MNLIEVEGLVKTFNGTHAVDHISFQIPAGRCIALLGPNGAGKTTTFNMLSGLLEPTKGKIQFKGDIQQDDLRKHIGYLPQHAAFHNWMTGSEFLIFSAKLAHLSRKKSVIRAQEIMELVGLSESQNRRISEYSGGMKQRLGLAQALIHRPKLAILDEPVSALDPIGRREVLELMNQIKQETTILFSTHVLHDAESISDDVMIMHKGKLVVSGSLKNIRDEHRQPVIRIREDEVGCLKNWKNRWAEYPEIDSIIYEQGEIHIVVNDINQTKKLILSDILEHQIPIQKFELAETSLEDLFIKVVTT